jgi:hypothetical protein
MSMEYFEETEIINSELQLALFCITLERKGDNLLHDWWFLWKLPSPLWHTSAIPMHCTINLHRRLYLQCLSCSVLQYVRTFCLGDGCVDMNEFLTQWGDLKLAPVDVSIIDAGETTTAPPSTKHPGHGHTTTAPPSTKHPGHGRWRHCYISRDIKWMWRIVTTCCFLWFFNQATDRSWW